METSGKWYSLWSVLGLAPFDIFIGVTDNGIERTLSKFTGDTELCDVVDTLEGRDVIQRHLDKLKKWALLNFMKFNKAKHKVLHLSQDSTSVSIQAGGETDGEQP